VLNPQARSAPRVSATAAVDDWLAAFLDNSEKSAADVFKAGGDAGFSEDQLQRARKRIGAVHRRAGMPSVSFWRIPGDDDHTPHTPHTSHTRHEKETGGDAQPVESAADRTSHPSHQPHTRHENETGSDVQSVEPAAVPAPGYEAYGNTRGYNGQRTPPTVSVAESPAFPRLRAFPWLG